MAPRLNIGKVGSGDTAARQTSAVAADGRRPILRKGSGDLPPRALTGTSSGDAVRHRLAGREGSGG